MDNTFENGFMCGMLLSGNSNKDNSKIKDPIFREILNNGIPVASVKLCNHYKIIYTLYHDTKYPQFYMSRTNIINFDYKNTVEELVLKDDSGHLYYPKAHSEFYGYAYGPLVLFAIFYKDEIPLVADYVGDYSISPSYQSEIIYNHPEGAYETNYSDYAKELVYWKSYERIFIKDKLQYLGDYTLEVAVDNVNANGSKIIVVGLLDKENNLVTSDLSVSLPINIINYNATYPTYTSSEGEKRRDYSKRPIISKKSETESTPTITIKYNKQYVDSSEPKYSDLTLEEILEMNIDIAKDIRETLGDNGCYTAKKAVFLN